MRNVLWSELSKVGIYRHVKVAGKPLGNERVLRGVFREVTGLVERRLNKEGLTTIQVTIFDKSLKHICVGKTLMIT